MSVHYRIDESLGRIETRCFGEVTLDEVLAHFDELSADPRFEPGLDVLLDLLECKTLPDAEQARAAAERASADPTKLRFGRLAVAVCSEALFGMARMFHALSSSAFDDAQVFRDREDALRWLDEAERAG